jgi:hypothetical protein
MKRVRDDTDFRVIRESYNLRKEGCLFCENPKGGVRSVIPTKQKY